MNSLAVGIGAGLVSALLFGVVITGSPLAMLLSYVSPLPVLIAALGWNHRAGLYATVAGGIATALAFRFEAGLAFALGSALPAWWIAYLALLGRPNPDGTMDWYPVGRLLLWVAGAAGLVTLAGVVTLGDGSYESYRTGLRQAMESMLRTGGAGLPTTPEGQAGQPQVSAVIDALVGALPFIAASVFALIFTLNLWLAAKVVQVSGRLPRPWPFLPATTLPRQGVLLLAAALAFSFLPGFVGAAALGLAGALMIAFSLQGLSFLHEATRGRGGRVGMLSATYILVLFVGHTVLPLLAILGLADAALGLRHRFRSGAAGPGHPST